MWIAQYWRSPQVHGLYAETTAPVQLHPLLGREFLSKYFPPLTLRSANCNLMMTRTVFDQLS